MRPSDLHSCRLQIMRTPPSSNELLAFWREVPQGSTGWEVAWTKKTPEDHGKDTALWKIIFKSFRVKIQVWPFLRYYVHISSMHILSHILFMYIFSIYIYTTYLQAKVRMMFCSPLLVKSLLWPSSQRGVQFCFPFTSRFLWDILVKSFKLVPS